MAAPEPRAGGGNVLTRKIGPLATWAWVTILLVPIVVYSLYERSKNKTSTAATATTSTTSGAQVPQFVNQTFTTVEPPVAPNSAGTTPVTTPPAQGGGNLTPPTPAPSATPPGTGAGPTEPVPVVTGERVNFAIGKLKSLGLGYTSQSGNRNPLKTYTVTGESPPAGTQVPKGSSVALTWKAGS